MKFTTLKIDLNGDYSDLNGLPQAATPDPERMRLHLQEKADIEYQASAAKAARCEELTHAIVQFLLEAKAGRDVALGSIDAARNIMANLSRNADDCPF
jgi:hypothetical protein